MDIHFVDTIAFVLLAGNIVLGIMLVGHPVRLFIKNKIDVSVTKWVLVYMMLLGTVVIALYLFLGIYTVAAIENPGVFGKTWVRFILFASLGLNATWSILMSKANGNTKKVNTKKINDGV